MSIWSSEKDTFLFSVLLTPFDTNMLEVLDEVDLKDLRNVFLSIFLAAQRGKLLDRYEFLGGCLALLIAPRYLIQKSSIVKTAPKTS